MSEILLTEQASGVTPGAGKRTVYVHTDGLLRVKDSAGVEYVLMKVGGDVIAPAGTLAAAGVQGVADANTGLVWSASDTLELVAGGVSQATVEASGFTARILQIWNAAKTFKNIFANATTAARTWTMPDKDGTVAMTSDITGGTSAGSFTDVTVGGTSLLTGTVGKLEAWHATNHTQKVGSVDITTVSTAGPAVSGAITAVGSVTTAGGGVTGLIGSGDVFSSSVFGAGSTSNHPLVFGTNSNERMRLDTAGNLGLGVIPVTWEGSGPGQKVFQTQSFAISSDINTSYHTNNAVYVSAGWKYIESKAAVKVEYDAAANQIRWYNAPSGTAGNAITFTQSMLLDGSGNLIVAGDITGDNLYLAAGGFTVGADNSQARIVVYPTTGLMSFYGASTEAMRLDTGGKLLVATAGALYGSSAKLQLAGGSADCSVLLTQDTSANPCLSVINTNASGDNVFHKFYTDTAGSAIIQGSIDFNRGGGVARYNTTSDGTLKNIIGDAPLAESVSVLESTRIREYSWKSDDTNRSQIGVIAQELYETFKGAVSVGGDHEYAVPAVTEQQLVSDAVEEVVEEDGTVTTPAQEAVYETVEVSPATTVSRYTPWAVDKTAFTFHLVAGFQHQQARLSAQDAQIASLMARLTALEAA